MLCDIDDTVTHEGQLPAKAYQAIEALDRADISVIPVTGRPAGWCDMIARFWPVAAVVGENGALYYRYDRQTKQMHRIYWQSAEERGSHAAKLAMIAEEALKTVPGCAIAADQPFRICDLAVDFAEDVGPLTDEAIDAICAIFEKHGAICKVSSIHVNGWYGDFNKRSMCERCLRDVFGIDMAASPKCLAYVGDSPNDQPMFQAIPNSIGVANVRAFTDRMRYLPRWITSRPGGFGFCEVADRLLTSRS